jgi:hypothetical protein
LGSVVFGEGAAGASGSEQVISISASFPQFSHLQTCFLTTFDICFPFLSDGFEKVLERIKIPLISIMILIHDSDRCVNKKFRNEMLDCSMKDGFKQKSMLFQQYGFRSPIPPTILILTAIWFRIMSS